MKHEEKDKLFRLLESPEHEITLAIGCLSGCIFCRAQSVENSKTNTSDASEGFSSGVTAEELNQFCPLLY